MSSIEHIPNAGQLQRAGTLVPWWIKNGQPREVVMILAEEGDLVDGKRLSSADVAELTPQWWPTPRGPELKNCGRFNGAWLARSPTGKLRALAVMRFQPAVMTDDLEVRVVEAVH